MKKKVAIIGAGGLGREIAALMKALPEEFEITGFYDDTVPVGTTLLAIPVRGAIDKLRSASGPVHVIVAIGDPQIKQKIISSLPSHIQYPVVIHPSVVLGDKSTISLGQGTVLTAGVKLTVDITIGDHVLINLNSTIGHNTSIGNLCSIMPGVNLAGGVTLGERVLIGSGANVINRVSIGDDAKVGSGAVVLNNILAKTTAVGVPARTLK